MVKLFNSIIKLLIKFIEVWEVFCVILLRDKGRIKEIVGNSYVGKKIFKYFV